VPRGCGGRGLLLFAVLEFLYSVFKKKEKREEKKNKKNKWKPLRLAPLPSHQARKVSID
jgi:hypothetical protein